MSLEQLRQRTLLALSQVCWKEPKFFKRSCPRLWMNYMGEFKEAEFPATSIRVAIVLDARDPKPGDPYNGFMVDYQRHYEYNFDPWEFLSLSYNWKMIARLRNNAALSYYYRLTKHSDGSLISHIQYLISVLRFVDEWDFFAKLCK
jgi:hypothetical protein